METLTHLLLSLDLAFTGTEHSGMFLTQCTYCAVEERPLTHAHDSSFFFSTSNAFCVCLDLASIHPGVLREVTGLLIYPLFALGMDHFYLPEELSPTIYRFLSFMGRKNSGNDLLLMAPNLFQFATKRNFSIAEMFDSSPLHSFI